VDEPHVVYEVWMGGESGEGTFKKFTELATATFYIRHLLENAPVHTHIHIVSHLSNEYHR
jgi:hypothetical protein